MIESTSDSGANQADLKKARRIRPAGERKTPSVDRLPPHSSEAELGVLGCIMLDPNESMAECIDKLKTPDRFFDLQHGTIFEELVKMYDEQIPIDVITLQQRLKDRQILEQVGGIGYLSSLADVVPSSANLSYYLNIVLEKFLLRAMVHTCTDAVGRIYEFEGEVDELIDSVETDILRVRQDSFAQDSRSAKDLVCSAIRTIEDMQSRNGVITGVSTGFTDLDKMTDGLHPGEMVVIAARPSMGKTSLAMNIAENVALDGKLPVGIFSLEMTAESLMLRMLCSRARVSLRNVKEGFLAERDFPKITGVSGKLASAPIYIEDSSAITILELRAKARRMAQVHGIKLFVVDYLQLVRSESRRADSRSLEIADISSGLKALSKELKVPVIVLSQLNREMDREKRRPRLSDLRESGAIEQDADFVGILYKPGDTNAEENDQSDCIPLNLLIAKQRNGPTGDVHLTFLKSFTRFESACKVSDDDIPTEQAEFAAVKD